jgi:hypothetical protein
MSTTKPKANDRYTDTELKEMFESVSPAKWGATLRPVEIARMMRLNGVKTSESVQEPLDDFITTLKGSDTDEARTVLAAIDTLVTYGPEFVGPQLKFQLAFDKRGMGECREVKLYKNSKRVDHFENVGSQDTINLADAIK